MATERGAQAAAILIAVIAIVGAISIAGSVFAPIAFAAFLVAVVWPLQSRLQSRLPRLFALAIVMVIIVVVFIAFASLAAWAFGRVGRAILSDPTRLQELYAQVAAWLETYDIALGRLWADHVNVGWLMRAAQQITGRVNTTLTFWLVVLIYVLLGLLEVEIAGERIRAMENKTAARVLFDGSVDVAVKFRSYLLVRTLMSVTTGALVWAFAALTGLQLAGEWGVIAFVLNYIPFIGPFFATMLPTVYALGQFSSWEWALFVFACLNVIQFVVGSYIEPRVSGNVLSVSPLVVLFAVFFWAYLWGIAGAFIGTPIMIAALTFCAQHPSSRWLSSLLGKDSRDA
jgi:predicted PurR-regulated permease PerM